MENTNIENLNVLGRNHLVLKASTGGQGLVDLSERNLATALDDTPSDPGIALGDCAGMGVDVENNADGETVLIWEQRADLGGDLGGQESAEPVDQVNGGAALLGLAVDERVGLDKVRNVRYVNTDFNLAVG